MKNIFSIIRSQAKALAAIAGEQFGKDVDLDGGTMIPFSSHKGVVQFPACYWGSEGHLTMQVITYEVKGKELVCFTPFCGTVLHYDLTELWQERHALLYSRGARATATYRDEFILACKDRMIDPAAYSKASGGVHKFDAVC
jgi:hypothetical protein